LSFYDASLDGIRILDLETGEEGVLPSGFGIQGAWSPDGTAFLFPGLAIESGRGRVTLHLADLISRETMEVIDQSYEWQDVGSPQWSPGGEWIAIGVQPGMAGPGRQIWLLKPDGSGAHPIVEDPGFTFGGYRWDPWGERLVFQRFALDRPDDQPEVWIWTIATKELARISESAWLPDWLP
jgi:dipeptidyl aminopeptidase/acylaminoacyl peptidase